MARGHAVGVRATTVQAMVNLKLFVEPMSRIGKIAIHWKQARPALRRVLLGQHNAPLSPH